MLHREGLLLHFRMTKVTTVILMMCLSCQLVLKLSIITWFEINQEYIAATLCENKDKPELVCCGKCVLTKELKKADDREEKNKNNTQTKAEKTSVVAFVLPQAQIPKISFKAVLLSVQNAIFPKHFAVKIPVVIFHPPSSIYS